MTDHQPRPPSYLLPYTTLQPTYTEIYADVASNRVSAENVWLSVYSDNAPQKSIHAGMVLRLAEKDDAMQEDRVLVEVNKGGNVVSVQEVDVDDPKGKGRAPSLVVQTTASPQPQSTSPTALQNAPTIPPTTLRLPRHTLRSLIKGRRSERAIEQGGGGQISAFDATQTHYIAGGEDGQVVIGQLPVDDTEPAVDESTLTIEERAQRRMAHKATATRTTLKGHVGDVRSAHFFPSGKVVLTTSSDLTIRLYSLDGINARTFKGHKRAVTCTRILARGKRFVSGSMDGTVRVWDVAAEKCLKTIAVRRMSGVESIAIVRVGGHEQEGQEEGVGQYILFAGLTSGWIDVISLRLSVSQPAKPAETPDDAPTPAHISVTETPLDSIPPIDFPSDASRQPGATDFWTLDATGSVYALDTRQEDEGQVARLVSGTKSGVVRLFDVDLSVLSELERIKEEQRQDPDHVAEEANSPTPSHRERLNFRRNTSSITQVAFTPHGDVVLTTQDGTPCRVAFDVQNTLAEKRIVPRVKEEYVGWEAGDPVEGLAVRDHAVVLAGAEGCLRVYDS